LPPAARDKLEAPAATPPASPAEPPAPVRRAGPPALEPAPVRPAPLPNAEGWRTLEPGALGELPPSDDLADVLRPIAPDGTYEEVPLAPPPPPRPGNTEDLQQAVRRAERLAAEARAAAQRHAMPPAGPPAGGDDAWSMDRFREGLGEDSKI
jgi:hypothetical protein